MWIAEWQWDDDNLDELATHGLGRHTVLEVAQEAPKFRRNRRKRAASHQMVGPDRGGRLWTVCIVRVYDETWRAITGWRSVRPEADWYDRQ